jgi:hypothetical protein
MRADLSSRGKECRWPRRRCSPTRRHHAAIHAQPQPTLSSGEAPPAQRRARKTPGWLIALIVFIVLAVLGVLLWLFARNLVRATRLSRFVPNVIGLRRMRPRARSASTG